MLGEKEGAGLSVGRGQDTEAPTAAAAAVWDDDGGARGSDRRQRRGRAAHPPTEAGSYSSKHDERSSV